jgi:hypothetical protein
MRVCMFARGGCAQGLAFQVFDWFLPAFPIRIDLFGSSPQKAGCTWGCLQVGAVVWVWVHFPSVLLLHLSRVLVLDGPSLGMGPPPKQTCIATAACLDLGLGPVFHVRHAGLLLLPVWIIWGIQHTLLPAFKAVHCTVTLAAS